jgi:DNA polymerase-3 subunit alpha
LNEARRLKIKVFPPHINHSDHQFSVVYPQGEPVLYMGLDQLRDLTHRTQTRILHNQPFRTLDEFILRVDPRKIELEYLIQVCALDGFGTIPALLRKISGSTIHPGQLSFFMDELDEIDDWSVDQKNSAQKKLLGISITGHPLERFADQITQSGAITTVEAITKIGETVRLAGVRQTLFRSQTEQGKWMGFLALEDLEGMIDVHLLPDIYQRYRNVLASSDSPILVDGVIEIDPSSGDLFLRAQKIMRVI